MVFQALPRVDKGFPCFPGLPPDSNDFQGLSMASTGCHVLPRPSKGCQGRPRAVKGCQGFLGASIWCLRASQDCQRRAASSKRPRSLPREFRVVRVFARALSPPFSPWKLGRPCVDLPNVLSGLALTKDEHRLGKRGLTSNSNSNRRNKWRRLAKVGRISANIGKIWPSVWSKLEKLCQEGKGPWGQ